MSPDGEHKRLRTDNGGEYKCAEFVNLMLKKKIRQEVSSPFSPYQNGSVERSWLTLFNVARSILLQSNLPK